MDLCRAVKVDVLPEQAKVGQGLVAAVGMGHICSEAYSVIFCAVFELDIAGIVITRIDLDIEIKGQAYRGNVQHSAVFVGKGYGSIKRAVKLIAEVEILLYLLSAGKRYGKGHFCLFGMIVIVEIYH